MHQPSPHDSGESAHSPAEASRPLGGAGQLSGAAATPATFRRDVLWNLGSTVVLAAGGFALLGLVGSHYGPEGLGIFAQVWAPYVIASQVAVGGLDRSILHALASGSPTRDERGPRVWSALALAAVASAAVAWAFDALRFAIADWYHSPVVAAGIRAAAPGLFFFGLNKVLLGVENGLSRMRAVALFQSLRYVLMPLGVVIAVARAMPAERVAFLFTFAESILFAALAVDLLRQVPWRWRGAWRHAREHAAYGARSAASGVLLELNSRVDVWMLGRFASDREVGLYNTALQVAEGVFQILIALQNNYNPPLARLFALREHEALQRMVRRGGRRTFAAMGVVGLIAVACFPIATRLLFQSEAFAASLAPFAILMVGIWLCSLRMPFFQALLMAGRPGWHSWLMLSVVGANVLLNALWIPVWGMRGAALATASAFLLSVLLLRAFVRATLGVSL